jgi:hypothetical protein
MDNLNDKLSNEELNQPSCLGAVIGWVSVLDELPKEYKFRMSRDVLTIAGSKMSVKSYDYELDRWNGSLHITVTHWMELPSSPCR